LAGYDVDNPMYHGTTHDFETFDPSIGSPEGDFGRGNYLTNSLEDAEANYAGGGPDLEGRMDRERDVLEFQFEGAETADEIEDVAIAYTVKHDLDTGPMPRLGDDEDLEAWKQDLTEHLVRDRLHGGDDRLITAYTKLDNPAMIGENADGKQMYVEPLEMYDEDAMAEYKPEAEALVRKEYELDATDDIADYSSEVREAQEEWAIDNSYYNEEAHPLQEAVRTVSNRFSDVETDGLADLDSIVFEGGSYASVADTLRQKVFQYATNDDGDLVTGEAVRQVFEEMGHDAVIDYRVDDKFKNMAGNYEGNYHIISFKSSQIKSADIFTGTPLAERFNDKDDRITFSHAVKAYDPNQKRGEKGSPDGGRWVKEDGGAESEGDNERDDGIKTLYRNKINPLISYEFNGTKGDTPAETNAKVMLLEKAEENGNLNSELMETVEQYTGDYLDAATMENFNGQDFSELVEEAQWDFDDNPDLEPNFFVTEMRMEDWLLADRGEGSIETSGYALADGRMLSMTYDGVTRQVDHREVNFPGSPGGTEGMVAIMNTGVMRMDYNAGAVSLRVPPTGAQADIIRKIAAKTTVYIDAEVASNDGYGESRRASFEVTSEWGADEALDSIRSFYRGRDYDGITQFANAKNTRPTIDQLSDNVLESLTGVTREWLSPVRPHFEKLAAMAMSKNVSDADFIEALEKSQREMPELFDKLNVEALQTSMEDAIGTAMIVGSVERYEADEVKAYDPSQKRGEAGTPQGGRWVKDDGGEKGFESGHFIGGVIPKNPRLPIFTTSERSGADWYAGERGEGGRIYEISIKAEKPFDLDSADGIDEWMSVLDSAGVEYEYKTSRYGWTMEIPEVANYSAYDGLNPLDAVYIPAVRDELVNRGYDSVKTMDQLERSEIPVVVLIKTTDQMRFDDKDDRITFSHAVQAYDPSQKRGEKGSPDGGRWVKEDGAGSKNPIDKAASIITEYRTEESIIADAKLAAEGQIPIPDDIDENIDALAFGYYDGEIVTTDPKNIDIFWTDDLANPQNLFDTKGMEWVESVDFSEPIELGVDKDGQLYIEDGHHRWFASEKLGRQVTGKVVKFKGNPLVKIMNDGVSERLKSK
jgi:hypothetical protein